MSNLIGRFEAIFHLLHGRGLPEILYSDATTRDIGDFIVLHIAIAICVNQTDIENMVIINIYKRHSRFINTHVSDIDYLSFYLPSFHSEEMYFGFCCDLFYRRYVMLYWMRGLLNLYSLLAKVGLHFVGKFIFLGFAHSLPFLGGVSIKKTTMPKEYASSSNLSPGSSKSIGERKGLINSSLMQLGIYGYFRIGSRRRILCFLACGRLVCPRFHQVCTRNAQGDSCGSTNGNSLPTRSITVVGSSLWGNFLLIVQVGVEDGFV